MRGAGNGLELRQGRFSLDQGGLALEGLPREVVESPPPGHSGVRIWCWIMRLSYSGSAGWVVGLGDLKVSSSLEDSMI